MRTKARATITINASSHRHRTSDGAQQHCAKCPFPNSNRGSITSAHVSHWPPIITSLSLSSLSSFAVYYPCVTRHIFMILHLSSSISLSSLVIMDTTDERLPLLAPTSRRRYLLGTRLTYTYVLARLIICAILGALFLRTFVPHPGTESMPISFVTTDTRRRPRSPSDSVSQSIRAVGAGTGVGTIDTAAVSISSFPPQRSLSFNISQ